jgi:hypothetical protein
VAQSARQQDRLVHKSLPGRQVEVAPAAQLRIRLLQKKLLVGRVGVVAFGAKRFAFDNGLVLGNDAVLAIIVWHFYNVHIKMFNRSMFTGRLTPHQMEEGHEAEWSEIAAGGRDSLQSRPTPRYRQGILFMAAIPFAALGIGGIYWAATAETTAISTLPAPLSKAEIYSPTITLSQEQAGAAGISAPAFPHPVAGQEQCDECHGPSGFKPVPLNHTGRPVESCRICHRPGHVAEPKTASKGKGGLSAVPHATTGPYKNCLICHK